MSGIFTNNHITFSECSKGSERYIFEISDRSGDEGEHKKENTEYKVQSTKWEEIIQLLE